jgi:hypothetical protein
MKFDTGEFYEKLSRYFNFNLDRTCLMRTLHEDLHVFLHVLYIREFISEKKNVSSKISREK